MKYVILITVFFMTSLAADIYSDTPWSPDARMIGRASKIVENDVQSLDYQTFNGFIKEGVVVIKFYAEWCGPCGRFAPLFANVAEEFSSLASFGRLNISTSADIASRCHVKAVPTVIVYVDGVEFKRHQGFMSEEGLRKFVSSAVNGK